MERQLILWAIVATISIILSSCHGEVYKEIEKEEGKPLIIFGKNATIEEYPHSVFLFFYNGLIKAPTTSRICGGVLICKNYVLTTAWCTFNMNKVRVSLGVDGHDDREFTYYDVSRTNFIIHHQFDVTTEVHDVALIALPEAITYTSRTKAANLYQGLTSKEITEYLDQRAWVTGTGVTETGEETENLLETKMKIIGNGNCTANGREENGCTICTIPFDSAVWLCEGDYGNGLLSPDNIVIGLYSTGDCQSDVPEPFVFTRISCYQEWIKEKTNNCVPYEN